MSEKYAPAPQTHVEHFNPAKGSKATADQMAAVMLLHGTMEQQREALSTPPETNVTGDNQRPRLHDEIAKARAYGLELAAQLIDANIIQDTSSGKILAPRQDGNRDGIHYSAAIRALATTEGIEY